MSDFTVHGIPGSPYVRAVLLTLEEKGAPYHFAARPMGGHRGPDYRAIHPFHKIPTLDHGGFRLYETHAILRYLDRVIDGPALVPDEPRAAARVDQLISFTNDYLVRRVSAVLSFNRLIAPMLGLPADEAAVAAGLAPAAEVIAELAHLLADQRCFGGDSVSLGDLMVAPHLDFLREYQEGRDLLAAHPTLGEWIERMAARPSFAATTWDALIEKTGVNSKAPPQPLAA